MSELAGFFSSIKNAAVGVTKVAAKVATAPATIVAKTIAIPTSLTQKVVSAVAPKAVSSLFNKVTNLPGQALALSNKLNPIAVTASVAQKALSLASQPAAAREAIVDQAASQAATDTYQSDPAAGPARGRGGRSGGRGGRGGRGGGGAGGEGGRGGREKRGGGGGGGRRRGGAPGGGAGFFEKMKAAVTGPTAVVPPDPAAGGGYPATQGAAAAASSGGGGGGSWGGGGGGGDPYAGQGYDGPDADDGSVSMDQELYPTGDSTEDIPDAMFESREEAEEGDREDLGDINYAAALGDLGDWKGDLANFGKTAAKTVATQALTAVGRKLTGGASAAPPPPPPGMSTQTKVAIGAGVLVGGYLLLGRKHRAA